MEYWCALYTKPHKELQVDALLQEQGIETYLPTVERKLRWRDRPDLPLLGLALPIWVGVLAENTHALRDQPVSQNDPFG